MSGKLSVAEWPPGAESPALGYMGHILQQLIQSSIMHDRLKGDQGCTKVGALPRLCSLMTLPTPGAEKTRLFAYPAYIVIKAIVQGNHSSNHCYSSPVNTRMPDGVILTPLSCSNLVIFLLNGQF